MSTLRPVICMDDVQKFFRAAASILDWDDLKDQLVIDVGCGYGNSSKTFAIAFPDIERLVAVDYIPARLVEAKRMNPHPKVEYEQADITNKFTIARWFGDVDVAISIFCFNCLADQKVGFENLFRLLKPGGQAAILLSLHSNFYDLLKSLADLPQWSTYTDTIGLLIPESHYKRYTAVHYRKLFEEIGYEVAQCTDETKIHTYTSDDECKDAIFKSCPLIMAIPEDLKEEFKCDLFDIFCGDNERNADGLLSMTYCTLSVLLRKPVESEPSEESEE